MQFPYLLEQRLEHVVIDRQEEATLLAAEWPLDERLAETDTAGGRFFGRNLQRTGPPAAVDTHSHIRQELSTVRESQRSFSSARPSAWPPASTGSNRSPCRSTRSSASRIPKRRGVTS